MQGAILTGEGPSQYRTCCTGRDSFATSITEAALEEVLAQVAKNNGAPSAVEAAASVAAPMGNLVP